MEALQKNMIVSTCIAPVNIAVIKYWGKRDEKLVLPVNDSLSATLCTDEMNAKTTVAISPCFAEDKIWLNGKEESVENPRLIACLREIRRRASKRKNENDKDRISDWKAHICSENNFPTAAGLASSAAGYACLVYCLGKVYGVEGDLSVVARLGSGSACRSLEGGFVRWMSGVKDNGEDSLAVQVVPHDHWPELRLLILVVSDNRKKVASTAGMKTSVETSLLLKHRASHIVPERVRAITEAIKSRDFHTFAELVMKDSNQFHAVCLDTYPPITYLTEVSHAIINFVHSFNKVKGINKVAYTFDAGPNACLFLHKDDVLEVMSLLKDLFPPVEGTSNFVRGIPVESQSLLTSVMPIEPCKPGLIKYVIHTKVGSGPKELKDDQAHLLNEKGLPKC